MSLLFTISLKILLYWIAISCIVGIPLLTVWSWWRAKEKRKTGYHDE